VVLLFLIIQQVENNALAPRISGHAVGLHPPGPMFAQPAGFQLAWLLGGLFAVRLASVLGAARRRVSEPSCRAAQTDSPPSGRAWLPPACPEPSGEVWRRAREAHRPVLE
jgi:predicted PurR-regulated permease PerM